ncbi:uncharacterized protein LOC110931606 [Helianthus annuus]|uniref:uncharacterized protein LOC110931606 n=1 Tax=Helianthus annuus TaxID=4232 RepID=UPI000B8FB214|nr:uncharacterized protein LOC110931606 [Helianthus annuus]
MEDCVVGSSTIPIGMREFYECVQDNELVDIKSHGMHFTWNQKPKQGIGVIKKLDRIMGNIHFLDMYPDAYALFHPFRISDHTPCLLFLSSYKHNRPKPFKFANFLATKEGFIQCVSNEWSKEVQGVTMFSVVKKLTYLKSPLRRLLYKQGNLHERVETLRLKLDEVQKALDANPFDVGLREEESIRLKEFRSASYDEECFLKQKAKAEWLAAGDSNTKFFHNCVKTRNAYNKILQIKDIHGNQFKGDDVYAALVNHYADFLGAAHNVEKLEVNGLFSTTLDPTVAASMIRQVTREEVKSAMFSIGENKAPGPDGYTSAFFKNSWEIVGDEVTKAILEFFNNGKLLKQINHTIIALVPKVPTPNSGYPG